MSISTPKKFHNKKLDGIIKRIINNCGNCSALEINLQMLSFTLSWKDWMSFFYELFRTVDRDPTIKQYIVKYHSENKICRTVSFEQIKMFLDNGIPELSDTS